MLLHNSYSLLAFYFLQKIGAHCVIEREIKTFRQLPLNNNEIDYRDGDFK